MWKVKTRVIPVVIGALETIPKGVHGCFKEIGVTTGSTTVTKISSVRNCQDT